MRLKRYEAAEALYPKNPKKVLFEECQRLKNEILNNKFEQVVRWAENIRIYEHERLITYELKKMKVLALVKAKKGSEALDYCKNQRRAYADIKEDEVRRLISYILVQSYDMWGSDTSAA